MSERFQPRVFNDFLTRLVARVVARSELTDMEPGGNVHTTLAAVAREEDDTHFQMVNLQKNWDIDTATGEDLDRRGDDANPEEIERLTETKSSGTGVYSRGSGDEDPVAGEDTGEAPDGIVTSFTFTLGDNGIRLSTITIDWTSGGVAKSMSDDGAGSFTGDGNAAGSTVTYSTGAISLDTAGDTPDASTLIEADYTPYKALIIIPAGSIVRRTDDGVEYATSAVSTIAAGGTAGGSVGIVALEAGSDGDCDAEAVDGFDPIAGVETFLSDSICSGGQDEESDSQYRDRIKAYIRSLPRGTPDALKYAVLGVSLDAYGSIVASEVVEGQNADRGIVWIYVDDGNGTIEITDDTDGTPEVVVASATGGEIRIFLDNAPVVDDAGSPVTIRWDDGGGWVTLIEDDDYYLNYATAQVTLIPGGSANIPAAGLTATDTVDAEYTWYDGLIAEAQKVVDGDPSDRSNYPGYRAAGTQVFVIAPTVYQQILEASVVIEEGYDADDVIEKVSAALNRYVNSLGMNGDVIFTELVYLVQSIPGVFDVTFASPTSNVTIGEGELARVTAANIDLTGA